MSDHNPLQCIWWADGRQPLSLRSSQSLALCEHDGCNWQSAATTEQAQIEAFIAHHTNRH